MSISVFFPAYNEEGNIRETVLIMKDVVRNIAKVYEIIIVDDGSRDGTKSIAEALVEEDPVHVRLVQHDRNQGYGAALISGIRAAQYEWVFFTDADLQFNLHEFSLLTKYANQYSAVIGCRAVRKDPFIRLVNAKGWNVLNRVLFGLRVTDIDCAFKLFRRSVVADLPLVSRGAMLSAEILIRLSRQGVVWKEVPVTHLPRKRGSPTGAKLSVIAKAFKEMMLLYTTDLGNPRVLEFLKFLFVGVINTSIDIGLYLLVTRIFSVQDLVFAKGFSYFMGTIFSFVVNRFWTFSKYSMIRLLEIGRFYITALLAILANMGAMYVFINILGFHDLYAVFLATCITVAWNFISMKFWVYSKKGISNQTLESDVSKKMQEERWKIEE